MAIAHLSEADYSSAQLCLFGGFRLDAANIRVLLPLHARRVLTYLALITSRTNDIDRRLLAERLWPDSPADRSAASLRTALWRIRQEVPGLVRTDRERVSLARGVAVDVHGFQCLVARLLSTDYEPLPEELESLMGAVDLLPGWEEDWLVLPREQLRQKRLLALESAAHRLCEQRRYPQAIELMLVVIAEEPLRESAHAILIDAHLRQGNTADASGQLRSLARKLWSELGVQPSPELLRKLGISPGRLTSFLSA